MRLKIQQKKYASNDLTLAVHSIFSQENTSKSAATKDVGQPAKCITVVIVEHDQSHKEYHLHNRPRQAQ